MQIKEQTRKICRVRNKILVEDRSKKVKKSCKGLNNYFSNKKYVTNQY